MPLFLRPLLLPPTGRARAEVLDLVVLNLELQSILNFTSALDHKIAGNLWFSGRLIGHGYLAVLELQPLEPSSFFCYVCIERPERVEQ